jgi:hypothetical protein
MTERRDDVRMDGPAVRQMPALVRPGQRVVLIDLSASGALVAGRRPLRPGARIEIHLHAQADARRATLGAFVVRCSIAAMDAERIVYHAALKFERRAEWVRERGPQDVTAVPWNWSEGGPDGQPLPPFATDAPSSLPGYAE